MRIDKYLWCVRLFKTRSDAGDAIKRGKVTVNANQVKPSYEVKEGDLLGVKRPQLTITVQVKDTPRSRVGAKLLTQYVEDRTPQSEYDRLTAPSGFNGPMREPGTGRPTKKERRELDNLLSNYAQWLDEDDDSDAFEGIDFSESD